MRSGDSLAIMKAVPDRRWRAGGSLCDRPDGFPGSESSARLSRCQSVLILCPGVTSSPCTKARKALRLSEEIFGSA